MTVNLEGDWEELRAAAEAAMLRAYAPYSHFPVGAAARVSNGRIVTGCNVENASYGLTLCAECTLIGRLQMSGGGRLLAFICVDREGQLLTPCGRCRQLLHEHAAPEFRAATARGIRTIAELLPDAFGPADLAQ